MRFMPLSTNAVQNCCITAQNVVHVRVILWTCNQILECKCLPHNYLLVVIAQAEYCAPLVHWRAEVYFISLVCDKLQL